jgi:hypothetical protein
MCEAPPGYVDGALSFDETFKPRLRNIWWYRDSAHAKDRTDDLPGCCILSALPGCKKFTIP